MMQSFALLCDTVICLQVNQKCKHKKSLGSTPCSFVCTYIHKLSERGQNIPTKEESVCIISARLFGSRARTDDNGRGRWVSVKQRVPFVDCLFDHNCEKVSGKRVVGPRQKGVYFSVCACEGRGDKYHWRMASCSLHLAGAWSGPLWFPLFSSHHHFGFCFISRKGGMKAEQCSRARKEQRRFITTWATNARSSNPQRRLQSAPRFTLVNLRFI